MYQKIRETGSSKLKKIWWDVPIIHILFIYLEIIIFRETREQAKKKQ